MKRFILTVSCFVLFIPFLAYGQSDIYSVKTPNVMIIFDTSNSMEQQPNGLGQGAGLAKGVDGNWYQFEGRGNHPGSKLYQAKQALGTIIKSVVQDRVNLGFSTYAQLKSPDHMWGLYSQEYRYHYAATPRVDYWRKLYYGFCWTYDSWTSPTVFTSDSFKDQWGFTHSGVTVGTRFTHPATLDNSPGNNGISPPPNPPAKFVKDLGYTVTSINYNAEYNWYTFTYHSDWYQYYWEWYHYMGLKEGSTCADDTKFQCDNTKGKSKNDFPDKWSGGCGWEYTYFSGDPGFSEPKWDCSCITYDAGHGEYYGGPWTQWTWSDRGAVADCEATTGTDNWGSLSGTTTSGYEVHPWTLSPGTCYKWADYYYPSEGSNDKPPSWSYFKIDTKSSTDTSKWIWSKNSQTPNYYPSVDSSGNVNNTAGTFDDHYFFINFPDDKAAGFKSSDRTAITNQILSYLDLTPVKSTGAVGWDSSRYWTTLPMLALYGRSGVSSNFVQNNNPRTDPPPQLTPLADSLAWANMYFNDYIFNYKGGDIASQTKIGDVPCRGNFIILLTDGLESARLKAGLPDYNAAVVEAANLLTINVRTFVVGFGTDIVGNQTLNNIANAGGTEKAYFAADLSQLQNALQAIFQSIASQFYGRSNPVITKARDRLFRGSFEIKNQDYYGHLMAWNADTQTGVLAPDFVWDSGEVMNTNGRGTIYSYTDSGLNPALKVFQASESSLYSLVNSSDDINNDGTTDNLDSVGVIKFTLDPNYNDCSDGVIDKVTLTCHGSGYYKGNRPLDWKLGDIYHSTPVVIGAPAFFWGSTDPSYQTFYNTYQSRETMIYVGTNDGFLHGFKNTDGSEKFAIIPKCLLGKLKNLSVSHSFYVDGTPKAYDVYFKADSKWRTVIISGLRDGGPYYFAVDVTDPNNPSILWEWTDPNMGNAWGKPDIGRVKVGTDTKFVAFLNGGYSTTDNKGNSFYIVDIETGTTLKMWTQSSGMPVGSATNKVPGGATAYDSDSDGFVNYVYFGDTSGTLWKVDVSSTKTDDWTLYDFWEDEPGKRLPIYYAPAVAKNDAGDILIFFGTGDEMNLTDKDKFYSFYEITDQGATGKQTWTRNLDPGEKVLDTPVVANWVVYFTTWLSSSAGESCGAGEGRLYGLRISKVGAPGSSEGLVTLDSSGKWTAPQSYISLGAGIPSAPIVTNGMIYISNSVNANIIIQIPIPGWAIAKTKSWREIIGK